MRGYENILGNGYGNLSSFFLVIEWFYWKYFGLRKDTNPTVFFVSAFLYFAFCCTVTEGYASDCKLQSSIIFYFRYEYIRFLSNWHQRAQILGASNIYFKKKTKWKHGWEDWNRMKVRSSPWKLILTYWVKQLYLWAYKTIFPYGVECWAVKGNKRKIYCIGNDNEWWDG